MLALVLAVLATCLCENVVFRANPDASKAMHSKGAGDPDMSGIGDRIWLIANSCFAANYLGKCWTNIE